MIIQIVACVVFFAIATFFVTRMVKKGRGALLVALALFTILYYFFYRLFDILIFLAILNLHLTLLILTLQDIQKQYLLAKHFVFLGLSVGLLRYYLNIPPLINIISVVLAFGVFFIPHSITRGKGLGLGDVIVFAILAVLFTPVEIVILFLFTLIGAVLFGLIQRFVLKESKPFPLVPFMHLAFFIYFPLKDFWLDIFRFHNLYLFQFI